MGKAVTAPGQGALRAVAIFVNKLFIAGHIIGGCRIGGIILQQGFGRRACGSPQPHHVIVIAATVNIVGFLVICGYTQPGHTVLFLHGHLGALALAALQLGRGRISLDRSFHQLAIYPGGFPFQDRFFIRSARRIAVQPACADRTAAVIAGLDLVALAVGQLCRYSAVILHGAGFQGFVLAVKCLSCQHLVRQSSRGSQLGSPNAAAVSKIYNVSPRIVLENHPLPGTNRTVAQLLCTAVGVAGHVFAIDHQSMPVTERRGKICFAVGCVAVTAAALACQGMGPAAVTVAVFMDHHVGVKLAVNDVIHRSGIVLFQCSNRMFHMVNVRRFNNVFAQAAVLVQVIAGLGILAVCQVLGVLGCRCGMAAVQVGIVFKRINAFRELCVGICHCLSLSCLIFYRVRVIRVKPHQRHIHRSLPQALINLFNNKLHGCLAAHVTRAVFNLGVHIQPRHQQHLHRNAIGQSRPLP